MGGRGERGRERRQEVWVESGNLGSPNALGVNPEAALAPDHSQAEGEKGEGIATAPALPPPRFGFSFRVHFQVNAARAPGSPPDGTPSRSGYSVAEPESSSWRGRRRPQCSTPVHRAAAGRRRRRVDRD